MTIEPLAWAGVGQHHHRHAPTRLTGGTAGGAGLWWIDLARRPRDGLGFWRPEGGHRDRERCCVPRRALRIAQEADSATLHFQRVGGAGLNAVDSVIAAYNLGLRFGSARRAVPDVVVDEVGLI